MRGSENSDKSPERAGSPEICAIVAVGDELEIGQDNCLLWRISEDLRRFKALTSGHPVIMGRKTRESLLKALPGRTNIVVTRNPDYTAPDSEIVHSLEEALETARQAEGGDRIFIIGGGQIYAAAMALLDRIEVTHVYEEWPYADTYFPRFTPDDWDLVYMSELFETPDGLTYGFESYVRFRGEEI